MENHAAGEKQNIRRLRKVLLLAILVLGLLPRLSFIFKGPYSIIRILPDDCFYYLKTCQYIALGQGSTFDGIHLTNGYHPLWMMITTALASFIHSPFVLLKTALSLSILASCISTLVLYKLLKKITYTWWIPLVGSSLYFFNPQAIANSMDTLGTAVSTLFFIIALYITVLHSKNKNRIKGFIPLLGVVLGLLFLARTDNVFYIIAFFFMAIYQNQKQLRLKNALILTGVSLLIISPWLVWSLIRFGSFMQSQGLALPFLRQQTYLLSGKSHLSMLSVSCWHFLNFLIKELPANLGFTTIFFPASIFALSLFIIGLRRQDKELQEAQIIRNSVKVVLFLYLAGICLVFSHTFWRWFPRIWYFDQLIILSAFFVGLALIVLDTKRLFPRIVKLFYPDAEPANTFLRAVISMVIVVLLLLPLWRGTGRLIRGDYFWQTEMLDAAYWLKDNSKKDDVAAAFNAGIISFFSERRVVNLDGAINNAAYAALKKKDLMRLMYQSGVSYYLDYDPAMLSWYSPFLGNMKEQVKMSLVKEISRPEAGWNASHIRIYRLEWLK